MALVQHLVSQYATICNDYELKDRSIVTLKKSRYTPKSTFVAKEPWPHPNSHTYFKADVIIRRMKTLNIQSQDQLHLLKDMNIQVKRLQNELDALKRYINDFANMLSKWKQKEMDYHTKSHMNKGLFLTKEQEGVEKLHNQLISSDSEGGCKAESMTKEELIPLKTFSKINLPPCYRHDEMFQLIKALANLTVMVEVSSSGQTKHKKSLQCTGKVDDVFFRNVKDNGPCPCLKCKNLMSPSKVWGEVRIVTSASVVQEDSKSVDCKCTLFYDDENQRQEKSFIFGGGLVGLNRDQDFCKFMCVTCDKDLLKRLDSLVNTFVENWRKAFDNYVDTVESEKEKYVFLVSHPYGRAKRVSVGRWFKDSEDNKMKFKAPTRSGTLGAFILVPTFDLVDEDLTFVQTSKG